MTDKLTPPPPLSDEMREPANVVLVGGLAAEGVRYPREAVAVADLSEEEIALIVAAEMPPGHRYEIDDLPDDP